jgi:uncharacterized protein (DUF58 family)
VRGATIFAFGDDPRLIDWNLYGRLGELHTKRFEARADLTIDCYLDRSASMRVRGEGSTKDEAGRVLAAGLAFGLAAPGRLVTAKCAASASEIAPSARDEKGARRQLEVLAGLPDVVGAAGLAGPRMDLGRGDGAGDRLLVISTDLVGAARDLEALNDLVSTRRRVALVLWSTAEERSPRPGRRVRLDDLETGEHLDLDLDAASVEVYLECRSTWLEEMRAGLRRRGIALLEADVDRAVEELLPELLRRLEGHGRARGGRG